MNREDKPSGKIIGIDLVQRIPVNAEGVSRASSKTLKATDQHRLSSHIPMMNIGRPAKNSL